MRHGEHHYVQRTGWLRAAVLGANDGIISTTSLIIGVAAAQGTPEEILVAGTAGLVAGAMSMAAGEYVSVSSQADSEKADLLLEQKELEADEVAEHKELTAIYIARGLDPSLARQVAQQLMDHNALEAHARDELGITDLTKAQPLQAALASAAAFSVGAALPLSVVWWVESQLIFTLVVMALVFLAVLGALSARAGGANMAYGSLRVVFCGALAMALTALVGKLFGVMV